MREPIIPRLAPLSRFLLFNYVLTILNLAFLLPHISYHGALVYVLVPVIVLTHAMMYLIPAYGPALLLDLVFSRRLLGRLVRPCWPSAIVVYGFAILGFSCMQIVLFTDIFIFRLYGFHLNAMVWGILTTRGGVEALGASSSTKETVAAMIVGLVLVEAVLLIMAVRLRAMERLFSVVIPKRRAVWVAGILFILLVVQSVAYGVFSLKDYTPCLVAADAFPSHAHVTFGRFAERWLGIPMKKKEVFESKGDMSTYPLAPLALRPDHKRYNIVWLVAESWRRDMLAPDIMPSTWAFAQKAIRFDHHYSSGNGTEMGMFGMFYGLYGPYWDLFRSERRGPVLMDLLIDQKYQMQMFTSAKFTYPEFTKTIMANVPPDCLHERGGEEESDPTQAAKKGLKPGWKLDRENVSDMLAFLQHRDPSKPFMTFMFFESPHAQYWFPPECAIRTPYYEELNYVTMDLGPEGIQRVKNRYVNSSNHLDTQFARIFKYLEDEKLLDSTIVVVTGDHGEEFMENGRWGHNSTFSQQQTMAPFVLWVPGEKPAVVERRSSHLDIAPTILARLGVTNPPSDYCLGCDLLATPSAERKYTVVSSFGSICIVDSEYKAAFPFNKSAMRHGLPLTTVDDVEVDDRQAYMDSHKEVLMEVMRDLGKFRH